MLGRWFGDAIGGLKWRPADFWAATIEEFFLAIDGHNRAQRPARKTMTREEFEDLDAKYPVKAV